LTGDSAKASLETMAAKGRPRGIHTPKRPIYSMAEAMALGKPGCANHPSFDIGCHHCRQRWERHEPRGGR